MRILKTMLVVLIMITTISINAQQIKNKELVKKTSSVEAVGFKPFSISWYCLQGKTASGQRVRNGVVAADTRIFPIGSVIEIYGLGQYTVLDRGSGIKGNKIDIWTSSCSNALKLGRKNILVKRIK